MRGLFTISPVIIECPNCHSKYQYNEARFEGKPSKKIKCAKCATIFEIHNPGSSPVAAAAPAATAAPAAKPVAAAAPASAPAAAPPAPAPQAPRANPGPPPAAHSTTVVGDQTFHRKPQEKKPVPEPEAPQPPPGKQAVGLQMPHGKRLSLAIIDGPDAGNVFRIEKPRVTIGRTGADLNLNDTEASRQHAAVEIRDLMYTVSDLGSTNGTLINGEKIAGPTEIVDKGEFVVGSSTLMLIVTEEAT